MVIENFLLGQISNKKWLKASICDVMCWCVSTKTVETKQMTWIEPWVFMHRLSVSHLVTVTSHIDATETTRAKCSWKMGLLRHSQTFGANTCTPCFGWRSQQEHWWAASRGKNEGGAGCGFDDSEARPPPPTSLSQHAATWPHMGQRQLLMSWHTRSSQPAFIKALGDFRSPHRIWVVLLCLSKLVKQQVVDAFWSTGYGGTGVPLAILILVCLPWSLKW